jgi:hypothetical protein
MVQVKVFQEKTSDLKVLQGAVNQFLQEHAQDIKVIDIKYTAEVVNPNNAAWTKWTAMVIFETDVPFELKFQ